MNIVKIKRAIEYFKVSCPICKRELTAITKKQLKFNYKRHLDKHKK